MGNNLSNPEPGSLRVNESQPAAETQDSSTRQNLLKEFINSAAYSGLEAPALGVAQFIGKDASNNVKGFFSAVGVEAPQHDSSTSGWAAQTIGGAVGMLLPFALTKGALKKAGAFGEAAAAESSLLTARSALGMSLKESAYTGFAYGAVLTPSQETDSTGTLLKDRLLGGVGSAATFTTLTAGSIGLGRLAETNAVGRLGIASALKNPILSGTISGLPGGIVSAEYESLTKQGKFASTAELRESMAAMALVGGVFGAKEVVVPKVASGTTYIADNLRSRFNTPDFLNVSKLTSGTERDTTSPPPEQLAKPIESEQIAKPVEAETAAAAANKPPVELLPQENALLSSISRARTIEDWHEANRQLDDLRGETHTWFSNRLDAQAKSLSTAELTTLWPEILKTDQYQGYRIAQQIGPSRTTEVWKNALESIRQSDDPALKGELGRTLVLTEPSFQLTGLKSMLELPEPPPNLAISASMLAPQNQNAAARMLFDHGITPSLELAKGNSGELAQWIFDTTPGASREAVINQLSKKVGNSHSSAEQVNEVFKIAQHKALPEEYDALRLMMNGIDPRNNPVDNTANRAKAYDGLDPQFIGRMLFHESEWKQSDQIAQTNPELLTALAVNGRINPSTTRSEYLADLMTSQPPVTPSSLAKSLSELAQHGMVERKQYPLSYGDLEALAQHAVKPAPNEVAPLLRQLRTDALDAFQMKGSGEQEISMARLLANMTLAKSYGKDSPELLRKEFTEPIEAVMSDSNVSYDRRLAAARVLGEMQRSNWDAANLIKMPDLRMGKFVELSSEQQKIARDAAETALFSRESMQQMIGDGPLGQLMPSVFGPASEGGIVGRKQHAVHDNTVDVHLLDVLEKAGKDPRFKEMLPKDQVNTLWASFLHDIAKRENMVDLDHGWTSTSTAWGALRTLGYPESQIQRITDIMGRDFDLSYEPDALNSVRFQNQNVLDDVVTAYRKPGALDSVAVLNASDIQSVKADGSWYTEPVIAELAKIQSMAKERVEYLNRYLLPTMTTEIPTGFGIHEMNNYNVMVHKSPDLTGQLLKHRSTIESPEFSMSVSMISPEHQKLYTDIHNNESPVVAIVNGPFEHIAQAHRGNLSTGRSIGWDGHVELVRRWAEDHRAERLAREAEEKLADLNIPPDASTAAENFPRLAHLRRILSQFETLTGLTDAAGRDNQYVVAAQEVNNILMRGDRGQQLDTHNEIKINNPILSGIGVVREQGQTVYFEGVPHRTLESLFNGQVPDYVRAVEPGGAPKDAVVVKKNVVEEAQRQQLPIVILNGAGR